MSHETSHTRKPAARGGVKKILFNATHPEELRVAVGFDPERLPLFMRFEETPGAKLLEALREERIGGFDQLRPPEARPSFNRNASTGR